MHLSQTFTQWPEGVWDKKKWGKISENNSNMEYFTIHGGGCGVMKDKTMFLRYINIPRNVKYFSKTYIIEQIISVVLLHQQ